MANKVIIIKASESTEELESLGIVVETKTISVSPANESAADSELANISTNDWIAGTSVVETNGNTSSDIRLPKSLFSS